MANGSRDIKDRLFHAVVDEMGLDPLRDLSWSAIQSIDLYVEHTVTQDEEKNTPLIAFDYYGDTRFWWIVQVYNGVPDMFSVKAGQVLKLPNKALVVSTLSALGAETSQSPRTATI